MQTLNRVSAVAAARDGESQLIEASLASDEPYNRDGYREILRCTPAAVDLSRARDGLPLILHHDRTQIAGRVYEIRADGRRVHGRIKCFATVAGREAAEMLNGGHREISVGYTIDEAEHNQAGDLIATRWTLLEVSIVAIPADAGIGVARSHTMNQQDPSAGSDAGEVNTRAQRRQAASVGSAETERVRSITATAASYRDHVTVEMVDAAIREGHTVERFNNAIVERMQTGWTDAGTMVAPAIIGQRGDPQDFTRGFSLQRAIAAQVDPTCAKHAGRELEISQELTRSAPMRAGGLVVPFGALLTMPEAAGGQRDMNAGTAAYGGAFVKPVLGDGLIDAVRARSVVIGMGATLMTGLSSPVDVPRKTTTTNAGAWLTEVQASDETQVGTGVISLSPKRIGAFVEPSRQLLITSAAPIEQMIRNDLQQSLMAELDRVALLGTGTANQPRGVRFTTNIGGVIGGANGATLTWQHVLDLEAAVDGVNGVFNPMTTGYLINGATRSFLKRTPRHATLAEGLMMGDAPPDANNFNVLNGYRCGVSSKVPNDLVKGTSGGVCSMLAFGDWSQIMVALFGGGVEIIVDPYSLASTGQVRITANLFADVGVRVAMSFATMEDAKLT